MGVISDFLKKKREKKIDAERKANAEIERIESLISKGKIGDKEFLFKTIFFDESPDFPYKYELWHPCWGNVAQLTRKQCFPKKGNSLFIDKYMDLYEEFINKKFSDFGIDAYMNIVGQTVEIDFENKDDFLLFKSVFKEHSRRKSENYPQNADSTVIKAPEIDVSPIEPLANEHTNISDPNYLQLNGYKGTSSDTTVTDKETPIVSSSKLGKESSSSFYEQYYNFLFPDNNNRNKS